MRSCCRRVPFGSLVLMLLAILPMAARAQQEAAENPAKSPLAAVNKYRDAVLFQNRDEYEFAADEWKAFLAKFPADPLAPKAQHYLGVCYLQLKQHEEAIGAFEKVLKDFPDFELAEQASLNLGVSYYNLAQAGKSEAYPQAADAFSRFIAKYSKSDSVPQAMFYLGESRYGQDKKDEAIKAWSEILAKYPQDPLRADALYAVGVTQDELGRAAEAGHTYDTFLKEFRQHSRALEVDMRRGDTFFAAGDYASAEKRFAGAAAGKDFALADRATMRWAASLYEQEKFVEAARLYASVVQDFEKSEFVEAATLAAGNCYYLAADYVKARDWLGKSLARGGETALEAAHWIARSYLKENRPAEALKIVEQALPAAEKSPQLVNLLVNKADSLYEMPDRRGEAAALYADIAAEHLQDPPAAQAQYMAGFAALGQGDFDAALAQAEKFLQTRPDHALTPDVKFIAAESHLQLAHHAAAEKLYRELLEKHAGHADTEQWQVRLALSLYLQQKYDQAIENLQQALPKIKNPEAVAEAYFVLGTARFERKDYAAAVKSLQASLAAHPKWRQADETLLNLSRAYQQQGDLQAAVAAAQQVLREHPQSKVLDGAHFRLAEYAYDAKDYKTAGAEYRLVLDKWPDSPLVPHALYGLGWTLLTQQDHAAAEATLSAFLEKHPDHALTNRARYARAFVRQQTKEYAGSLDDVKQFLKTDPPAGERADALYVQGLSQAGLKQSDEAIKTFRSILDAAPDYAGTDKVRYELAWALKGAGKEAEAADAFTQLALSHPSSVLAAESLFHVGEYQYHQKKDYKRAASAYYKAYKTQAGGGKSELGEKIFHKLAWAFYQQNDFAGAQQSFASQVATYPQGPLAADGLFMHGESLFKLNRFKEAIPVYQKALGQKVSQPGFHELALLHAAQSQGQLKQWDESLKLLARFFEQFADSDYRHDALVERGLALQYTGKPDEARKLYETVADESTGVIGARARFMVGEILFLQGDHTEAIRNYFKVAYGYGYPKSAAPFHAWQSSSLFEAAICFGVKKETEKAKRLLQELIERFPSSDKVPLARQELEKLE